MSTFLSPLSEPLARGLNLPRLPEHFGGILTSFVGFHALQRVLAPFVLRRVFPASYGDASKRVQRAWTQRAVSMAHALVVVPLALRCLSLPALEADPVFGADPLEGRLEAIACGYFLWDALEEGVLHFQDLGFAVHGLAVLFALGLTFRPLFAYTSVRFLVMEMSTIFLNIHWALDKTGQAGTRLQLVNGVLLLGSFFGARICYGSVTAYRFFKTLSETQARLPSGIVRIYAAGTGLLQALNWYWMYKMVASVRSRFDGDATKGKGRKSVE